MSGANDDVELVKLKGPPVFGIFRVDETRNARSAVLTTGKCGMNAQQVQKLVDDQVGNNRDTSNHHGVDLHCALVSPKKITVIERTVQDGRAHDRFVDVWLVLVEKPDTGSGYRIVFDDVGGMFGLASEGFQVDRHLVLCGWYGDFMTTFHGM